MMLQHDDDDAAAADYDDDDDDDEITITMMIIHACWQNLSTDMDLTWLFWPQKWVCRMARCLQNLQWYENSHKYRPI